MRKAFSVTVASLAFLAFAITALLRFELYTELIRQENQRYQPVAGGPGALSKTKTGQFWSQETRSGTKYIGFLDKSCVETLSFGYTWFSTMYNIVCDKKDPSPLCTLWLESPDGSTSPGEKSLALWKQVHQAQDAPDIIVKMDDDTIIQKHVLDAFVDDFALQPCVIAGTMVKRREGEYNFWQPLGSLYMYKRSAMPPKDSDIWKQAAHLKEDEQIGFIMGVPTSDYKLICSIDKRRYYQNHYDGADKKWDKRIEIRFRDFSPSCPAKQ